MTHPTRENWMDYLYGELDPKDRSALTIHLRSCPECQANVVAWRGAMSELSALATPIRQRDFVPVRQVVGWGIAATLVFSAGLGAGRLMTPPTPPTDVAALREEIKSDLAATLTASLEPKIRANLKREMNAEWQTSLAVARERIHDELKQDVRTQLAREVGGVRREVGGVKQEVAQVREDVNLMNRETLPTLTKSQRTLGELLASHDAARTQERQSLLALLRELEQRQVSGYNTLQNDIATIAALTENEFLRTQKGISELVAYVQPSQSPNRKPQE